MLYRIVIKAEWETGQGQELYAPPDLAAGGFVHLCQANQVLFVAERHFGGVPDLVVLEIDPALVNSEIRYEESEPGQPPFPHVYGPIPWNAVVGVTSLENT